MSASTTISLQNIDTDLYQRYNVHLEDFIHLMHVASRIDQAGLNTSEIPNLLLDTGWTVADQTNSTRDFVNGSGYGVMYENTDEDTG